MAQTNFTPILLYSSSTPTNAPSAGNLTNSTNGSEIAINIADKNLFFKDSGGVVNTVPIRQSSASSNGWLSSTDWSTFNNKAPATSGTSILYGNGTGGFSNVTIGSGISFAGGTLSATGSGGTVTSVAALTLGTTGTDLSSTVANGTTTPVITLNVPTASATNRGALSSTDWSTFNGKQAALVSGTNIKTVGGVTLLGSGDVGTIGVGYGGTGLTTLTAGYIPFGNGTSAFGSSINLFWNSSTSCLGVGINNGTSKLEVAGAGANNAGARATYEGTIKINEAGGFDLQTTGGLEFKGSVFGSGYGSKIYSTDAGSILFGYRANSATWTESMRISNSGGVSIGNTTDPGAGNLSVTSATTSGNVYSAKSPASFTGWNFFSNGTTAAGTTWGHFYGVSSNNSVQNIVIYGNGNILNANNSYGSLSDAKLKENIVDASPKLNDLMKVQIRSYNLKGDYEQHKQLGVVAQELEQIFPGLVEETADSDSEGNILETTTKSVKYSVFVPMLIKAMQEQQEIIEQLKAKVGM